MKSKHLALLLVIACLSAVSIGGYAQQKPTLKQLEQQAKERLEEDRRRRKELEARALDKQRREAAEAAAAAAAAAEAERQRLLNEAAEEKARYARTPVVKGDSLVCPNGRYRRGSARLVGYKSKVREVLRTGWELLPDYWTEPPVRAYVFKTTELDARWTQKSSVIYETETKLKALADMISNTFLLARPSKNEILLSLVGKSDSDNELIIGEEITLRINDKVYDGLNFIPNHGIMRPVVLCIDDMLQQRQVIPLYRTSTNEFGEKKSFSLYSVLVITDISFTEITATAEQ